MRKMLVGLGLLALLAVPVGGVAQEQSGWSQLGEALGGDQSELAYQQGLLEGLQRDALLDEARTRKHVEWVRSQLTALWQVAGFSPDDAISLAAAYEPAASEAAVIAGIRRAGAQSAIADIVKALDAHNYLLANQLVLAYVIANAQEKKTSSTVPD